MKDHTILDSPQLIFRIKDGCKQQQFLHEQKAKMSKYTVVLSSFTRKLMGLSLCAEAC